MPGITRDATKAAFGAGLRSLNDEESKQDEMTSHFFDVPAVQLFNSKGSLTKNGQIICKALAYQLRELPFQASIQYSNHRFSENLASMMDYLFHTEMTRPGQLSMSVIENNNLAPDHVRIVVRRFTGNLK